MNDPCTGTRPLRRILAGLAGAAALLLTVPALAVESFEWSHWWLPKDHSEHGHRIDTLFVWIFWITTVALVLVQALLVYFLIVYRRKGAEQRKAHFIHGNTRLEMAWTLAPAVILAVLALASKDVWHRYRYNEEPAANRAQIMVVGEQFQWNVIYPGPDGKVGKYLRFPHPSDPQYRALDAKKARSKANSDIYENPLGKVTSAKLDPDGADDDWVMDPGRPVFIPENRTVEILLGSKDVLHDFFLPNFRVKLDAVPGMIGHIYFKSKVRSTRSIPVEQIKHDQALWVDRDTKGAAAISETDYGVFDPGNDARLKNQIEAQIAALPQATADKFKAANLNADAILKRLNDDALKAQRDAGLKPLLDAEIARLGQDANKPLMEAGVGDVISGVLNTIGRAETYSTLGGMARMRLGGEPSPQQIQSEVQQIVQDLKRVGITHLTVIEQPFEIVCEELCGMGHGKMRGLLIVLSESEYRNFINKNAAPTAAPTASTPPAGDAADAALVSTASQGN